MNITEQQAKAVGPRGGDVEGCLGVGARRSDLFVDLTDDGPTLHRYKPVEYKDIATDGIQNEKPWHRMAAFMLLAGKTNKEIAAAADVQPQTVSNIRAQRWFQQLLAVLANEHGQDLTGLLQSEAVASLQKMVAVRDSTTDDVPERLRYQAARDLFELAHGKAVQKVVAGISSRSSSQTPQEEFAQIQAELHALERKDAALPLARSVNPEAVNP